VAAPLQYLSTMVQSNAMAMMMMAVATGGKVVTNPNQQKLTRRDITDQRIISNILQFNSPTA